VITPYYKESIDKLRRCHKSVLDQSVQADPPDVPLETDRGGGVVWADEGRGRRALIKSWSAPN